MAIDKAKRKGMTISHAVRLLVTEWVYRDESTSDRVRLSASPTKCPGYDGPFCDTCDTCSP